MNRQTCKEKRLTNVQTVRQIQTGKNCVLFSFVSFFTQDIEMCNSAFEAPIQFILAFAMMAEGIIPQPGQETKTYVTRHNTVINIRYDELFFLGLSTLLMMYGQRLSWQKFYPNKWFGYLLVIPSIVFNLISCALIVTVSSELIIVAFMTLFITANFIVLHKVNKTAKFGNVVLSSCLSIVFPIGSLPSSPVQKQDEKLTFFWLAFIKTCLLLLMLFSLNVLYRQVNT